MTNGDFHGGPGIKNPPTSAEAMGLMTRPGRFHTQQSSEAHVPQLTELVL